MSSEKQILERLDVIEAKLDKLLENQAKRGPAGGFIPTESPKDEFLVPSDSLIETDEHGVLTLVANAKEIVADAKKKKGEA